MKKLIFLCPLVISIFFTACSNKSSQNETQESQSEVKAETEVKAEEASPETKKPLHFTNEQFYDAEGNFLEEKAKDALIEMLEYHDYPVFDSLRDKIWVTDYNVGNYAELGLASVMFVNNEEDQYMLMDIFLLPNQMLGEHMHVAAEGNPVKMEGWLVRHGKSYVAGIGENNRADFPQVVVPNAHWDGKVSTNHIIEVNEGGFAHLVKAESSHWQMAGSEGAVITEVGNVHTGAGVHRSDPKMN
ncbi:hypothetical protein Fleli_2610 [Bernardetia litoralis DSM 6794]|uniref:D-lyxose ketol-isomerase n=1 Tax=Bernardetia litoralis (strain ATCC 23117 / DSM 6794 / NBRC 15988 / NCIMB 1366 / Fx l1 / Sio-4) TaxID=880071 RepID=I4ALY8_BERLS|nr:hypothetical protein [Bernardetia litoralis]AFM04973.1 hypothetical protein Fleli_2610 [Bernardetia litoralis DSM 6794]